MRKNAFSLTVCIDADSCDDAETLATGCCSCSMTVGTVFTAEVPPTGITKNRPGLDCIPGIYSILALAANERR